MTGNSKRAKWNPRYVQYARVHGQTPGKMLALDMREDGPKMMEFSLWIQGRWAEWRKRNGLKSDAILSNEQIAAFDAWLETLPNRNDVPKRERTN